ncbi:MAG: DUF1583 domain-containing protein [Planctomycetota bacterium]
MRFLVPAAKSLCVLWSLSWFTPPLSAEDRQAESSTLDALVERATNQESGSGADSAHAAAAIHRQLMRHPTQQRYELLKEFAFVGDNGDIRTWAAICDVKAPPMEVARLVGERRRRSAFSLPFVGAQDGLFSTNWELLRAAKEAGRLRELEDMVRQRTGGRAIALQALIVADEDGEGEWFAELLQQVVHSVEQRVLPPLEATTLICVGHAFPTCRETMDMLQRSIMQDANVTDPIKRFVLGARLPFSTDESLQPFLLNDQWIAIDGTSGFFAMDDRLTHIPGGATRYWFRYPIMGDFEFQMEQIDPQVNDLCLLGYEGKHFGLSGGRRAGVNQRKLRSRQDSYRFLLNGYRKLESKRAGSPWITITPNDHHVDRFRNVALSGRPKIAREVDLLSPGNLLHWHGDQDWFWNRTDLIASEPIVAASPNGADSRDQRPDAMDPTTNESRHGVLRYDRPLLAGEQFQFEFFAADDCDVHPVVGRLVFLMDPGGVQLRWITHGENDWTGLPIDNKLVEPLKRRGPKTLPLHLNQWNRMSLSMLDSRLTLNLNGTTVYVRDTLLGDDTRFGWYRESTDASIEIRKATLSGDWPEQIDLPSVVRRKASGDPQSLVAAAELFREADASDNVVAIVANARDLPGEERVRFLTNWVLPNDWHDTIRLASDFMPLHTWPADGIDVDERGVGLISAAMELLDSAEELHQVDQLIASLDAFVTTSVDQQRNRAAFLALCQYRLGRHDQAFDHIETLYQLDSQQGKKLNPPELWPEYLVAKELIDQPDFAIVIRDLIEMLRPTTLKKDSALVAELIGLMNHCRRNDLPEVSRDPEMALTSWLSTAHYNAQRRSQGHGEPLWESIRAGTRHLAANSQDFLLYDRPLLGDYEVQLESQVGGWKEIETIIAGTRNLISSDAVVTGDSELGKVESPIDPPLSNKAGWRHQRFVIRDGVCTAYANGRQVHRRSVVDGFPWLGFYSHLSQSGAVRNVRIVGSPEVPDSINLLHPTLPGWRSYYGHSVKGQPTWTFEEGHLNGRREKFSRGFGRERFIYYQRPLMDGDEVQYQFFYQPGEAIVHPALDRMALVIDTEQVGVHQITDGQFDATFRDKNNLKVRPVDQRRRPDAALLPGQWNQARVSVHGDQLELRLNEELVFLGDLNPNNPRLFGFFYYSDRSQARVRDVTLHGSWPTQLPGLDQNELVDPELVTLNQSRDALAHRIEHDFGERGVPAGFFTVQGKNLQQTPTPDGIGMTVHGDRGWQQAAVVAQFQLEGDFDVLAEFRDFHTGDLGNNRAQSGIRLLVPFDGTNDPTGQLSRTTQPTKRSVNAQFCVTRADGSVVREGQPTEWLANSGTLRVARRGNRLFMLVKESETDVFRHLRSMDCPTEPVQRVNLVSFAASVPATSVVWKRVDIRADQISLATNANSKQIAIIDADGSNVVPVSRSDQAPGSHGTPRFSPDGSKIAFQVFRSDQSQSRIYVINSDGTGFRDLGQGKLPAFMPDGKRIVFPGMDGLTMIDVDGSNRQVFWERGSAVQPSPDGKYVVFNDYDDNRHPNMFRLDLATKQTRPLFEGPLATRYSYFYWNADWSPDGHWIGFYGRRSNTRRSEFAMVHSEGSSQGFQVLKETDGSYWPDVAWHPDNNRLLILRRRSSQLNELRIIKVDDPTYDEPFSSRPELRGAGAADWSSDGRKVVVSLPLALQRVLSHD